MADVTGDINGQPVSLNNAATETTLKMLLEATMAMAKSKGLSDAEFRKLERNLKKLQEASQSLAKELTEEQKQAQERIKEKEAQQRKEKKAFNDLSLGLGTLFGATEKLALGMTSLMNNLANVGNSLTSAANSLNSIPIVGNVLSGVFGAVAGAADRTYKSFQQAATVGANFGGSITDMVYSASAAGLTFEQLSGIVARNGEALALLGGSTSEGAKRLSQLGKEIRNSGVGDQLARLGFSTEDINNGMAKFAGVIGRTGALQNMTNSQLVAVSGKYLQNLDAVSKLTGKNREALQAEHDARLADAQFMAMASKLDAESQANLHALMDSIPKEHQAGLKEIMSTGTATSEAAQKAMAFLNRTGSDAVTLGQQIQKSGKLSQAEAVRFQRAYQQEAKQLAKSPLGETLAKYDQSSNAFMAATYETAGRQKDLGDTFAQQAEEAKKGIGALDPAKLKAAQEQIAETSNRFAVALANSGLLEHMLTAFNALANFTESVVLPLFQFLANNATMVGIVMGTLAAGMGALSLIIAANNVAEKLKAARLALSSGALSTFGKSIGTALRGLLGPVGLLITGATALYGIFNMLKNAGFDTGMVFEAIGDNLKRFSIAYVDIWLSIAEKIAKFFGGGDKIKSMREKLALERAELDEKEKARDQRRRQNREEIQRQNQEKDASKGVTEAKKEEAAKIEETTKGTTDYNDSLKILQDRFKKSQETMTQPGASAVSGLGSLAARYESGGRGTSAIGWDSTGGTSYGKYQIATKTGTMDQFMKFLEKDNPAAFARLKAAGPADSGKDGAFAQEWKKLASEGLLGDSEHKFIKATHFDKGMSGIKNQSLKAMVEQSKALQEVMWSTSVQHGGGGASGIFGKVYKEGMSEQDLIKAIYAERGTRFGSSTAAVQKSVQNRFASEQQQALELAMASKGSSTMASASPTAVTPAAAGGTADRETPQSLLAGLNNKMDQLIKLTANINNVNERQLTVQQSYSGDLFAA
jgi:hypothetical protein